MLISEKEWDEEFSHIALSRLTILIDSLPREEYISFTKKMCVRWPNNAMCGVSVLSYKKQLGREKDRAVCKIRYLQSSHKNNINLDNKLWT